MLPVLQRRDTLREALAASVSQRGWFRVKLKPRRESGASGD